MHRKIIYINNVGLNEILIGFEEIKKKRSIEKIEH